MSSLSKNICTSCLLEDTCKKYGWDNVDHCVNYKPTDDIYTIAEYSDYNAERFAAVSVATDDVKQYTLEIGGCERIILKDKSLDFQFELTKGKIEDFDEIIINGIEFKRVQK